MPTAKNIEKNWIENFKKSPLIDKDSGLFLSKIAQQLFYGKQDESYPSDYPYGFTDFYTSSEGGGPPDSSKQFRLEEQLNWADSHGQLKDIADFLLSLTEEQWFHIND